jgi:hypothetical protein
MTAIPTEDDTVIMSIRLKSGKFHGEIEVPLYASKEERETFVEQWLLMMEAGLKVGQSNRSRP